jgi:DNA-binding transcriptional LysR family regulator
MDRIDGLRLFIRLAERGSFSAAARDLKIKQSTASKWVTELEADLGASLVQRTTRSIHITEAGKRLLTRARDVLAAYDDLGREFEDKAPELRGRIRLSVPVVFGRLFVVPALAEFLTRHPEVRAEVALEDRYVNLVEHGFDLAVRVGIPADTGSPGRKLADSRRVLVASPAYLEEHPTPKAPEDLRHHECLVHGEMDTTMIWRFGRAGSADVPVDVRGRFAANSSEAVLVMARRGFGIALLADWLVMDDVKAKGLVPLLSGFITPPAPIYALRPPAKQAPRVVRALTEHLARSLEARYRDAMAS